MKFKSILAVSMAAAFLATSCSKDNTEPNPNPEEGVKTYMQLDLKFAAGSPTRAATFPGSNSGTSDETTITELNVYMFNSVGVLEQVEPFTGGGSQIFQVTSGSKTVVVLANMGSDYPAATVNSTTLNSFKQAVMGSGTPIAAIAELTTANEFWMSGIETGVNLGTWDGVTTPVPSTNDITITVTRLAAKVGVEFAPTSQVDGTLSQVEYKVHNNPNKVNLFATRDASNFLATPYYQTAYSASNYFDDGATDYIATTIGTFNPGEFDEVGYMMENSNTTPVQGNSTMLLIKGVFTPTDVLDPITETTDGGWTSSNGFFRIAKTDGSGNILSYRAQFYSVDPDPLVTSGSAIVLDSDEETVEYTSSLAYYPLWLNDTESGLPSQDKYVVERNTAWNVVITSVSGCGSHTPSSVPPGITDPLDVDTYMQATITVANWVDRGQQGGI